MAGWKGFTPAAPRFFADASEVPPSNRAAAPTIRADLGILFLHALGQSNIKLWALQIISSETIHKPRRLGGGRLMWLEVPAVGAAKSLLLNARWMGRGATMDLSRRSRQCWQWQRRIPRWDRIHNPIAWDPHPCLGQPTIGNRQVYRPCPRPLKNTT